MLVLTRKTGERLLIADDIEITVVAVRGDQVRLGITAPRDLRIVRAELLDKVRSENVAAARAASFADSPSEQSLTPARSQSLKPPPPAADTKSDCAHKRIHHPTPERRLVRR